MADAAPRGGRPGAGRASVPRVLVVVSGGGHWVEMERLRPAFEGFEVTYITTDPGYRAGLRDARLFTVNDASRDDKLALLVMAVKIAWIMLRVRPTAVISTGAAPGYVGVRLGRILGARTAWIDSMANAQELSLSGRLAGRYVDLWLTQWPHLARDGGPLFRGRVL